MSDLRGRHALGTGAMGRPGTHGAANDPEGIAAMQRALERSSKRLQVDVIDLWYVHYPDPATPVDEIAGATLL